MDWIDQNEDKLIELSDCIWSYAEAAMNEYRSASCQADYLEGLGFAVERGVGGMPTAFVASYGKGTPVIGILGEYDALPGLSQHVDPDQNPVKKGAPGHGCGHNLLGVAALGAAAALKNAMEAGDIEGTVRYYGCPAEETLTGKVFMVKAGLFTDVDMAITWHPGSLNSMWIGSDQAMNSAKFRFFGRTAHAAGDPWNGRSALDAVELMNVGANYLREHIVTDGRVHYVITNGGEAPNIVPDEAEAWYYVRAPKRYQVEEIYDRLVKIAEGAALMTETRLEIEFLTGCYNTLQNNVIGDVIFAKMKEVGAPAFTEEDNAFAKEIAKSFPPRQREAAIQKHTPEVAAKLKDKFLCDIVIDPRGKGQVSGGSTDVADVSWVTPTAQFTTACDALGTAGHSWQFTAASGMGIGHKGMLTAARIMALAAVEFYKDPSLVEQAKAEFAAVVAEEPYKSPLPDDAVPPVKERAE
jgi:aminobenzoyl-glutamate utilization protein B